MKKLILAGSVALAAVTIASVAQAADVNVAPAYDWSGFYLGANAGVSWNNSSLDNDGYANGNRFREVENKIEGDQTAFTAGGLLGYNYQIDQIVLGAEADFNYLGFSDSNKRSATINNFPDKGDEINVESKTSLDVDWFGTIRGRLGYAIDNVLIYGTGGLAYGHVNADAKLSGSYDDGSNPVQYDNWKGSYDQTNWGWTVGGGLEYGIDKWTLGAEYLYVDLGDGDWSSNHDYGLGDSAGIKGSANFAFSTVRATVKYRF